MTTAAAPAHDLESTAARRARGPQADGGGGRGNLPAGARQNIGQHERYQDTAS